MYWVLISLAFFDPFQTKSSSFSSFVSLESTKDLLNKKKTTCPSDNGLNGKDDCLVGEVDFLGEEGLFGEAGFVGEAGLNTKDTFCTGVLGMLLLNYRETKNLL